MIFKLSNVDGKTVIHTPMCTRAVIKVERKFSIEKFEGFGIP